METTLYTGDRLIVNRLPVTWSSLKGKTYVPARGEIIVFKNPRYTLGADDEYIVKRVIGLPGERVVLKMATMWYTTTSTLKASTLINITTVNQAAQQAVLPTNSYLMASYSFPATTDRVISRSTREMAMKAWERFPLRCRWPGQYAYFPVQ